MIQFMYTKPNGDVSDRLGVVINSPMNMYQILDLSDLDDGEIELVQEQARLYLEERKSLLKKYKLNAYFKSFLPANMSGVIEDV